MVKSLKTSVALVLLAILSGCTTYVTDDFPTYNGVESSGTVRVQEDQILRAANGASGAGYLLFQGWEHEFVFEGAKISVTGDKSTELHAAVYNLSSVEDFEGSYEPFTFDFEAHEGLKGVWGKNEKGVVIYVRFSHEDVQINKEAAGLKVTLRD